MITVWPCACEQTLILSMGLDCTLACVEWIVQQQSMLADIAHVVDVFRDQVISAREQLQRVVSSSCNNTPTQAK